MKDITLHVKKHGIQLEYLRYGDTFRFEANGKPYEYMRMSLDCVGLTANYRKMDYVPVLNLKSGTARLLARDTIVIRTVCKLESWFAEEVD